MPSRCWSFGDYFDNLLEYNTSIPEWQSTREHIGLVFDILQKCHFPKLIKVTNTLLPFRPYDPYHCNGESAEEYERRKYFITVGYYLTVCDAVEKNRPDFAPCPGGAIAIVNRELPRLRALLEIIQAIVRPHHLPPFLSLAPSQLHLTPKRNVGSKIDLDQVWSTIAALGGWKNARTIVSAHVAAKSESDKKALRAGIPAIRESITMENAKIESSSDSAYSSSPSPQLSALSEDKGIEKEEESSEKSSEEQEIVVLEKVVDIGRIIFKDGFDPLDILRPFLREDGEVLENAPNHLLKFREVIERCNKKKLGRRMNHLFHSDENGEQGKLCGYCNIRVDGAVMLCFHISSNRHMKQASKFLVSARAFNWWMKVVKHAWMNN